MIAIITIKTLSTSMQTIFDWINHTTTKMIFLEQQTHLQCGTIQTITSQEKSTQCKSKHKTTKKTTLRKKVLYNLT